MSNLSKHIRAFCKLTHESYPDTWCRLYKAYEIDTGINVLVEAKKRGIKALSYASKIGAIPKLWELAQIHFPIPEGLNHTPAKPAKKSNATQTSLFGNLNQSEAV
jgi:hypothetical protein